MSLPLDLHGEVRREMDEAYRWYERQGSGLGAAFLDAVNKTFEAIVANPLRFGFADVDVREGAVRRFPYAVYYCVLPDKIWVIAVFHTARDPAGWQSRA